MYKLFVRPHLNYDDQAYNNSFQNKIQSIQNNAGLEIPQERNCIKNLV